MPPVIEFPPRILIVATPPGAPSLFVTTTPAAWPCKASSDLKEGNLTRSVPFTELTDPVTSLFLWVPYPTTTTSSRFKILGTKFTLRTDFPATGIFNVAYPIKENTRVELLSDTSIAYLPFISEITPLLVPSKEIFTPIKGSFVVASLIVPDTVTC